MSGSGGAEPANTEAKQPGRALRVAMLGPYPSEEGKFRNGVESVVSTLADGLVREGVDVFAVTVEPGTGKPVMSTTSTGVNVCRIPTSDKLGNLTGFAADARRIRAALDEIAPDVVHVQKMLVYARAALGRKWPWVLTIHGIHYQEAALRTGWDGIRARFACRYEREAVRRAGHVICINRYAADSYRGVLRARDVRFIDNPVDDRYFDVPRGAEKPGRILFAGLISERKNVLGLLEAMELVAGRFPGSVLRIVGKAGDRAYHERCLEFVTQRKLENNVEFAGMLSVDELTRELAEACLLVLPSKQETAPVVISEAMAAGKPVVATPAGGTEEMVEDAVSGLIVGFDDSEALAGAIGRLLDDPELRKRMSEAGRAIAEQRFRRSVVLARTLSLYHDIAGTR
jgi:glycosyltransferase involved in cell wall biosynthesis